MPCTCHPLDKLSPGYREVTCTLAIIWRDSSYSPLFKYFICLMYSLFSPPLSPLSFFFFPSLCRSSGHGPVLPFADNLASMFTPGSALQQYFEQLTYLLSSSFFDLNLNRDRMSVYTSQLNFALSRKNLAHLVQTIVFEEFAKFDYGQQDNQHIYGKLDPPEYDISAITNRTVAIIYSANDEWASVQDFESIGHRMRGKSLHPLSLSSLFFLLLLSLSLSAHVSHMLLFNSCSNFLHSHPTLLTMVLRTGEKLSNIFFSFSFSLLFSSRESMRGSLMRFSLANMSSCNFDTFFLSSYEARLRITFKLTVAEIQVCQ